MTEITKKEIIFYVIKNTFLSALWTIYFLFIFWVPLGNVDCFDYVKAIFDGTLNFNSIMTFAHPIFLLVYTLMVIYNVKGIIKVLFSKDRFLQCEDESESIYIKISSRPGISAMIAMLVGMAIAFCSMGAESDSFNFGIAYAVAGMFMGFIFMLARGKNKSRVFQREKEVIDLSIKETEAARAKEEQEQSAITEQKLKNLNAIAEYKKMYDDGIITQEEFENKKKELLNT